MRGHRVIHSVISAIFGGLVLISSPQQRAPLEQYTRDSGITLQPEQILSGKKHVVFVAPAVRYQRPLCLERLYSRLIVPAPKELFYTASNDQIPLAFGPEASAERFELLLNVSQAQGQLLHAGEVLVSRRISQFAQ